MLSTLHPLPKLALCLIWICASVLVFDLGFQLVTLGLATLLLWLCQRVPLWRLLALMLPFALFGFGFLTTSVLFGQEAGFARHMAAEQGGQPDALPGLVLFARALACGMVSALFVLTTDPGRLVRSLMRTARLPPAIGFALLQAMHLVPDLGREMQVLRMSHAMRRGRPMRKSPRPAEVLAIAVPLLAFAIRRASRAALAMEARGLRPGQPRTQLPQRSMGARDAGILALGIASLIVTLLLI